jgi:putative membrane protein
LHIQIFFLVCVIAAGAYGGYSVSPKILAVQAAPALIALVLLWLA